jgi:hypothetical protein
MTETVAPLEIPASSTSRRSGRGIRVLLRALLTAGMGAVAVILVIQFLGPLS